MKKQVGTEVTIFVYNAAGQLVAEYATTAPTSPVVNYLTADHLGSPRINTDASGTVIARHDYMPFGEELIGTGTRSSGINYGSDGIRQKFTSKERDDESGLDFYGERYYFSRHARFTTCDPLGASARASDPQTFNRYTYVHNNPLRYVDPDGMDYTDAWSRLTSDEQKIIGKKLVMKKGQSARDAFNQLVTVKDKNQTIENVIAIKNVIDVLGGHSNSAVWQKVESISNIYTEKNHLVQINVTNATDFRNALEAEIDGQGNAKYAVNQFLDKKLADHPNDTIRQRTEFSNGNPIHLANDDSSNLNAYFVHFDSANPYFRTTTFPNDFAGVAIPGSGTAKEMRWAAKEHERRVVWPSLVRQYLKSTGQVPNGEP